MDTTRFLTAARRVAFLATIHSVHVTADIIKGEYPNAVEAVYTTTDGNLKLASVLDAEGITHNASELPIDTLQDLSNSLFSNDLRLMIDADAFTADSHGVFLLSLIEYGGAARKMFERENKDLIETVIPLGQPM